MRVGLYFGSFNPIHTGHLGLANYLLNNGLTDELWFVVSPHNPLKNEVDLLDEKERLAMVQLAVAKQKGLRASDVEFQLPRPSYTIDTLRCLSKQYSQHSFSLLIGSDNALLFNQWKEYKSILADYEIRVYPREEFCFANIAKEYPQMQLLEEAPRYNVSSTEIRRLLKKGKNPGKMLTDEVYAYILKNRLYEAYASTKKD